MSRTLVSGDCYVDLVARGVAQLPQLGHEELVHTFEYQPGGSAGYVAAALTALRQPAIVHTVVGTDVWGQYWIEALRRLSVQMLATSSNAAPTGLSIVMPVAAERAFLTCLGTNVVPRQVPRLEDVTCVALSGVLQAPGLWTDDVLADVAWYQNREVPVFVDGNWTHDRRGQQFFHTLVCESSFAFLNAYEACALTGEADPVRAGVHLIAEAPHLTVVVKLGAQGAYVINEDGVEHQDGEYVADVQDANGAGDCFLAAFIAAWQQNLDPGDAIQVANHVAALAIAAPTYHDRLRKLQEQAIEVTAGLTTVSAIAPLEEMRS